jgi:DNA-binding NtrC family response regulator
MSGQCNAGDRLPDLICAFVRSELQEIVKQICSTCLHCGTAFCADLAALNRLNDAAPFAVLVEVPRDVHAQRRSLEALEALKKYDCVIVACGDDAKNWGVGVKSRVFLAGATILVDSLPTQFAGQLIDALQNASQKHQSRQSKRNELLALTKLCRIIGESPALLECFQSVLRMSKLSDLPTLITGESGTGKELFASALHVLDPKRSCGPFVAVNCAAVNASLAESEFFGHVRGAFTGAHESHDGYFSAANGGVLFLDEVGELSLDLQAKLLRVIQERHFSKVGSTQQIAVDVRVVSATHQDLQSMILAKRFREDLLYRLNTLTIRIPPLRERKSDIAPLVSHFLASEAGNTELVIGQDFVDALSSLDFPGNVRELKNLVLSALVNRDGDLPLGLRDLPPGVWHELSVVDVSQATVSADFDTEEKAEGLNAIVNRTENMHMNLNQRLAAAEREIVSQVLIQTSFNQSRAAQVLGITPRCVYNKVKRYQLSKH